MAEGDYATQISLDDYFRNNILIPVTLRVDPSVKANNIITESNIKISPNPFDESLRINLNLPYTSEVNVRIVNLQGSTVTTIANEKLPIGSHTFYWDGKGTNNQNISSGVYLIVITDKYGVTTLKAIKN
jgi:flagellar hook assembly protein FlgD